MNEMNLFMFITNISVVLLCGALLPVLPLLTRKSFLFGVKIPPEAQSTGEAKALKHKYVFVTAFGGIVVFAASIIQYVFAPNYTFYAVLLFPFVLIAIQLAVFVPNHSKALELKSQLGWNVSEIQYAETINSFTRGNLSAMPHFWYVMSLVMVITSLIIAAVQYPNSPDMIPTHWNFNMEPDSWLPKSLGTILMMPLINLTILAFMWLVGVLIERAKLQIDHKEPAKSFAQHTKYRRLMGHSIGLLTFAIVVLCIVLGFQSIFVGFAVPLWLVMAIIIVPTIPVCVISVRAGQGGTLLKVDVIETDTVENSDITGSNAMSNDKYWAWGLFYHNPDDPACFVGDRFGTNLGFNYSRLPVKICVAIGVAALIVCYVWVILLFQPLL